MRGLIRLMLVLALLLVVGFFAFGWWSGSAFRRTESRPADAPTGTSGSIDVSSARQRGAELGEKAARATADLRESVAEAGISAKIKAKMVLDDTVKARAIDVTTSGTAVTLSGTVHSEAERAQALRLARDTVGVTSVVDRLQIVR